MKQFLLLLLIPLNVLAQNNLTRTHTAVFFNPTVEEDKQVQVLTETGISEHELIVFKNRDVIFVPEHSISETVLMGEESVDYFAPVYTNLNHEFVTYKPTFFVQLRNSSDFDLLKQKATEIGVEIVGPNQFLQEIIQLKTNKNSINSIEAVNQLKATGLFKHVSPDLMHTVSDCSVNDPRFERQWNLQNDGTSLQGNGTPGADINVVDAWNITTGSPDVKIAILDSGVDTLHPELEGKLLPGFDAFGEGTNGHPTPNFDEDGHGTSCAGIAAANTNNNLGVAGVCPDCSVIPVRIFRYQNLGGSVLPWSETQVFIDGISWQWQIANADISSNSWAVPDDLLALFPGADTLVNAAIDAALDQGRNGLGTVMVFSSGNDGLTDTIPVWPARYERTIAVGATSMCDEHKNDTSCDNESWWAGNWGEGLDVSAPGVKVATIDMMGTNGFSVTEYYNSFNGTSAACPNVAGTVGLMLTQAPNLPQWLVRKVLGLTADRVGGYDYSTWKDAGNWSYELGYGRINATEAVTYGASSISEATNEIDAVVEAHIGFHRIAFEPNTNCTWELFDINGRVVNVGSNQSSMVINHNKLNAGIYALRVLSNDKMETIKLLIP